jgi:hypothetical protein
MTRPVSRTALTGHTVIAPHPLTAPPGASQRLRSVTLSSERPEPGK